MVIRKVPVITVLFLFFPLLWGCDYARMKEQEAVQTYKEITPDIPQKTIPITGGLEALRRTPTDQLRNPLPHDRDSIRLGKEGFGHFCIVCHGPNGNGNGTVGQSFHPLPTDLRSSPVQNQSDGKLFYTLTFGLKRHPALGFMTTEKERWAIIHYVRTLPEKENL